MLGLKNISSLQFPNANLKYSSLWYNAVIVTIQDVSKRFKITKRDAYYLFEYKGQSFKLMLVEKSDL